MLKKVLNLFVLILVVILFSSCGTRFMYTKADLIKKSNAELLDAAAKDAGALIVTWPIFKSEQKYVVMSSEKTENKDNPLNAIIEDAIIGSLSKSGFTVLERDKDILVRIAYQEGNKNIKSFLVPPEKDNKEKSEIPKYDIDYGKKTQIYPAKINSEIGSSAIDSSDYIISYRILETGVKFIKINERDDYGLRQIKRSALVKLNIRVINSKTSKIIWSDSISGTAEDLVPQWQAKYLEESGYEFYPYSMPLQQNKK